MALRIPNFSQLQPVDVPSPLDRYKQLLGIQTQQANLQDIQAQASQRQLETQQKQQLDAQKRQNAQQAMSIFQKHGDDLEGAANEIRSSIPGIDATHPGMLKDIEAGIAERRRGKAEEARATEEQTKAGQEQFKLKGEQEEKQNFEDALQQHFKEINMPPDSPAAFLERQKFRGTYKAAGEALPANLTPEGIAAQTELKRQEGQLPMTPYQQAMLGNKQTEDTERQRHERVMEGVALAREKRESAAATPVEITPNSKEFNVAQDLAYGKLTFNDFKSLYGRAASTANLKTALYEKARQLNPDFNPAAFEMGFKFASNPKTQQQLASIDNVITGVPDLLKFSDQASRTGVKLLNDLVIKGGAQVSNKNYSNLQTARVAFADELSGALGYGSATDMSREMGFKMTDPNLSPEAFKDGIQTVVVPFVERKRASMLKQMGPYGQAPFNPNAPQQPPAQQPPAPPSSAGWKLIK